MSQCICTGDFSLVHSMLFVYSPRVQYINYSDMQRATSPPHAHVSRLRGSSLLVALLLPRMPVVVSRDSGVQGWVPRVPEALDSSFDCVLLTLSYCVLLIMS